ncbi:MAG: amino acid ABC transporter substrate-binding protein [Clostridia bacterium]|nr:amino acid ABC transporter substrate-binding protein [Clostridia bacterium]MDY2929475.1 amino acid ABC transporter substrate-binding protein [Clostridiaceae bacterium]
MKKWIALLLAIVLCLSLAACGSNNDNNNANNTTDDQNTPAAGQEDHTQPSGEKQKLIVGFDAEFPPFGFIAEDGSYDGFDLAMAKELCSRLGWDFEAVAIDWDTKDAELKAGSINCIWNGFTYTGREEEYTWSDPYVENKIVLVVKADSGITSMADLAGKTVMAQAASSAVDAIEANEEFKSSLKEVVELGDYNMGFMELAQGSVDAVAADMGVAAYQAANNEGDYVILDDAISTEQYAIGFLKGNTELRDAVNAELLKMAEDGTMMSIGENYVDQGLVLESLCLCK